MQKKFKNCYCKLSSKWLSKSKAKYEKVDEVLNVKIGLRDCPAFKSADCSVTRT